MKRKNTDKSPVYLATQEDLSDVSDVEDAYGTKVANIQKQLSQLENKTHPEFVKICEDLQNWLVDQKQRIQILHEHKLETIDREYAKEIEACDRDCEHEKRRIQTYLVSLCEELKRRLEHDKKNIELTPSGDVLEFKPAVTRKLRRRAACATTSNASIVSSSLAGDSVASNSANFMYWGDLLLCGGARWPLSANSAGSTAYSNTQASVAKLHQVETTLKSEMRSPNVKTKDFNNNNNESQNTLLSEERNNSVNIDDNTSTIIPTSCVNSVNYNFNKTNLFGSLGLNLFDGSLLSHLLTSMNHHSQYTYSSNILSNHSDNNSNSNSTNTNNSTSGLVSELSSFFNVNQNSGTGCRSSSNSSVMVVAAAAVAAGLIMPSNGLSTSGGLNSLNSVLQQQQQQQSTGRKRRQQNITPSAQLNLLLPEHDIYADLTIIHRTCSKPSVVSAGSGSANNNSNNNSSSNSSSNRKLSHHNNTHSSNPISPSSHPNDDGSNGLNFKTTHNTKELNNLNNNNNSSIGSPNSLANDSSNTRNVSRNNLNIGSGLTNLSGNSYSVWIDDGKLYYGQKCYQNGASVILEGRDGSSHKCAGTIVSIGAQDLAIRRLSDHGICRVTVQQLKQGRYALWPNKSD